MPTGHDLYALAASKQGQAYEHVLVPKDNPNWRGPWDCAELISWVVYQGTQRLYGCVNNHANPALADAYSGAWANDAQHGTLLLSDEREAMLTAGVVLIRTPPLGKTMGHVAISDGTGHTMEAMSEKLGVRAGSISGRVWDYFCRIPGVEYSRDTRPLTLAPAPFVLRLKQPNTVLPQVTVVQQRLATLGFDPGTVDGAYGPHTVAAVIAFQAAQGLVTDGVVGPETARALDIDWPE